MTAGVDEVGRGPLAGPVVAAAVILDTKIDGIMDSKCLSAKRREALAEKIRCKALAFAYGRAEVHEIEQFNIHHATLLAMKRAIEALAFPPVEIFVDGLFVPETHIPCKAIIKGDSLIYQISAASILAKVMRDTEMIAMESLYPGYGFAQHKGYGTQQHQIALKKLGPSPIHRKTFRLDQSRDR